MTLIVIVTVQDHVIIQKDSHAHPKAPVSGYIPSVKLECW